VASAGFAIASIGSIVKNARFCKHSSIANINGLFPGSSRLEQELKIDTFPQGKRSIDFNSKCEVKTAESLHFHERVSDQWQ
jgi:hypothetical protein